VHDADHVIGAHTEHKVGAVAMAVVAEVAAGGGAEHRGGEPDDAELEDRLPVTGDGVLDDEVVGLGLLEEEAPVAAVEGEVAAAAERRAAEGGGVRGGDEAQGGVDEVGPSEEAEQAGGVVEAAERMRRQGLQTREARTRCAGSFGGRRRRISATALGIGEGFGRLG